MSYPEVSCDILACGRRQIPHRWSILQLDFLQHTQPILTVSSILVLPSRAGSKAIEFSKRLNIARENPVGVIKLSQVVKYTTSVRDFLSRKYVICITCHMSHISRCMVCRVSFFSYELCRLICPKICFPKTTFPCLWTPSSENQIFIRILIGTRESSTRS